MKRAIAAAFLMIFAIMFMQPGAESASAPITSKYPAPTDLDLYNPTCDTIDADWDASPHADFYVLRISDDGVNWSDSIYVETFPDVRLRDVMVQGLDENKKWFAKVGVVDSVRHRLSGYSKVATVRTLDCP